MCRFRYEAGKSVQDRVKDWNMLYLAQFIKNKRKVLKIVMSLSIKIAFNENVK